MAWIVSIRAKCNGCEKVIDCEGNSKGRATVWLRAQGWCVYQGTIAYCPECWAVRREQAQERKVQFAERQRELMRRYRELTGTKPRERKPKANNGMSAMKWVQIG